MHKQHVVYQRLSSNEQLRNDIYSLKRQDALIDLIPDNQVSIDEICDVENEIKSQIFKHHNVTVIKRDLGVSSKLGMMERPGLRYLCDEIRADNVEAIYIVEVSRLFRDNKFLEAPQFVELCEQHGVKICAIGMEYDFSDKFCRRIFLSYADFAGMERDQFAERTLFARRIKRREGRWAGGTVPIGYQVVFAPNDRSIHHRFAIYEPHAEVVREVFQIGLFEAESMMDIIRICKARSIYLPDFEPETREGMHTISGLYKYKDRQKYFDEHGIFQGWWPSITWVRGICRNPFYYGTLVCAGEVVSTDDLPAIVTRKMSEKFLAKFTYQSSKRKSAISELSIMSRGYFTYQCGHMKSSSTLSYAPKGRS